MRLYSTLAPVLASAAFAQAEAATPHVFRHENVLGTSLELKVSARDAVVAARAEAAALAEIDRLEKILSSYRADSDYARWFESRGEARAVPAELFDLLALYDQWSARTGAALNAGGEAVSQVWRQAASAGREPDAAELAAAVSAARGPHWRLDAAARTATHLDATPLSLGALGKGFIVDRAAAAALKIPGVTGVLVNIGGDLCARGDLVAPVQIANPRDDAENAAPIARLELRDRALATSGDYRRGFVIGGRRHSHIVDPRDGRPAERVISASVVASDLCVANALSTTFCILPPEESLRLAAATPGVECLLVAPDGRQIQSPGWALLAGAAPAQPEHAKAPAATAAGLWDGGAELLVELELARPEGRAPRPFVAVWIEDQDHYPVRTLALWYRGNRWLPDLRSWHQAEQLRSMAEGHEILASVSSATRAPGKYTLKWDGKDGDGKPVKAGRYTVLIETAREHGTHQLVKQEMDFSGAPRRVELAANVEIASAALDYRRKAPSSR